MNIIIIVTHYIMHKQINNLFKMSKRIDSVISILCEKARLCHWDEDFECYVWSQPRTLLTGITKQLRVRFYLNAPRPPRVKLAKRTGKFWKRGKKGGTMVHEQLEEYVEQAKIGILKKDLDPRVQRIIKEALMRKLIIVDSEYCVGDKDLHLGTGVDLLCLTEQGEIVVIEIKTGFDGVQYGGPMTKRMRKPFNMMDVSPWSQHQLQLLTTVGLFEKMTGLRADHAEVWVVGTPNAEGDCSFKSWPLHPIIIPMKSNLLTLVSNIPTKKRKYVVKKKSPPNKKSHTG
jgi:hypothetical protein